MVIMIWIAQFILLPLLQISSSSAACFLVPMYFPCLEFGRPQTYDISDDMVVITVDASS